MKKILTFHMFLLVFVMINITLGASKRKERQGCKTYNEENGICVNYYDCSPDSVVKSDIYLDPEGSTNFCQQYMDICCPVEDITGDGN